MSQVRILYDPPYVRVVEWHTHKSKELGAAGANPASNTNGLYFTRFRPAFCYKCNKEFQMSKHLLGSDRVLHEGAGYRSKYTTRIQKPPVGSRENPSNPKQEGTDAIFVPTTAKWVK